MTGTMTRRPPAGDSPGVDPRIVARREQVASAARRRRHRVLGGAAATVVVLVATVVALRSPLLDVEQVVVAGTGRVDDVRRAGGVAVGDALVEVDAAQVRRRVMALPWVASARVEVDWPRSLRVVVTEEPAVAVVPRPGPEPALVVGRAGLVVGEVGEPGLAPGAVAALPRIAPADPAEAVAQRAAGAGGPFGPVAGAAGPGDVLPAPLPDVVAVLEQLPASLRGRVAVARLGRSGALTLELADGGTARFGPVEDVPAKLLSLATVLGGRVELRCLEVVDLREPLRPTVSRRAGCALPPPTGAPAGATTAPSSTTTVPAAGRSAGGR